MTSAGGPDTVAHPRIAPGLIARRDYQLAIAHEGVQRNTLVILPTGMGKTVVALLVVAERLQRQPGKVLLLAPTKPLVEQHAAFLRDALLDAKVEVFTGETPPAERELAYRIADIICSTPQVVQNDLVAARFDLQTVTMVLFDEAHRAVGNYAYVFIAEQFRRLRLGGLMLAMTASPGAKPEKVKEICDNLGIEGVEVRTEEDEDTKAYVQDTDVEWKVVAVPESLKVAASLLRQMYEESVAAVRQAGGLPPHIRFVGKKALLDAQRLLSQRVRSEPDAAHLYKALSAQAAALKLSHALELVETQGVASLHQYLERLANDTSKAAKAILEDARMIEVQRLLASSRVDHPKLRQVAVLLRQQIKEKPDARIIVFTNYRDTAETLVDALAGVEGVKPARFVGQASRSETDRGMSQKKQVETIEQFKAGTYNVLVATSVAEEGLDIPQTDLVIFYEPVPSEVRAIQRRGRTGRKRAGRVVILITKDTRDETSHWASRGKETKMKREVEVLRRYFKHVNASEGSSEWRAFGTARQERSLDSFDPGSKTPRIRGSAAIRDVRGLPPPEPPALIEKGGLGGTSPQRRGSEDPRSLATRDEATITILADHREFNSAVVRELAKAGIVVKPETLPAGDYVLSDRVAVERKEAGDFATSLVDGRLFEQAKALRDAYSAPILLIEGEGLLTARRVQEGAIWSAIASLVADFHVSVITTKDASETARVLLAIAKREQGEEKRPLAMRGSKAPMSDDERLRYLVEGLPNVSAVLSRRLLDRFGTVHGLVSASVDELREVEGVGKQTAEAIHRILRTRYLGRSQR